MKPLIVTLLCAAVAHAQYTVAGTVVNAASGMPVDRAHVTIAPHAARNQETGLFTGADGRFRFENLPVGTYVLAASSRILPDQVFGMKKFSMGAGVSIITGPGKDTQNLRFLLVPPSAISGKVIDESNEPVRGALVQVIYSGVVAGRRYVRHYRYAWTNAAGEYRMGRLPAGEYYLAASGVPWYSAESQMVGPDLRRGYATVYFPNSIHPDGAAKVKLAAGQEISADFRLTAAPAFNVTIRLPSGRPSESQILFLVSHGAGGLETFHRVEKISGGQFVLRGVLPGQYTVRVLQNQSQTMAVARQAIDVGGSDVEVNLAPLSQVVVNGVVNIAGGPADAIRSCVLRMFDMETKSNFTRQLDAGGGFRIPAVPPGSYEVQLSGLPGCSYMRIQSIKAEGAKAQGARVEIGGAPVQMTVLAQRAPGAVRGIASRGGAAALGVTVVLAPAEAARYPDHVHSWITDSDGSYDFTGIAPGKYLLLALDDEDEIEFTNPAVLRPYWAKAQTVEVVGDTPNETRIELPAAKKK